jgi:hypothetical protein
MAASFNTRKMCLDLLESNEQYDVERSILRISSTSKRQLGPTINLDIFVEVYLHALFISALDRAKRLASSTSRLSSQESVFFSKR